MGRSRNRKKRRASKPSPKTFSGAVPAGDRPSSKSPEAEPFEDPPRELAWFLGLTALAWVHRAAFLLSNRDRSWPVTVFYEGDSETFFRWARAILGGQLYDAGLPFHPPGFAYFLAFLHTLVGAADEGAQVPHLAVKLLLALVSSASVGLLYLLVRPYLGQATAVLAAALCLYHFGLYTIAVAPVTEGLYLTLLLTALLVWSRRMEHPLAAPGAARCGSARGGAAWGLALGVLLGFAALTRAEAVLVGGLLGGVGVVGRLRQHWMSNGASPARIPPLRTLTPWLLVACSFALALAPWTLRNLGSLRAANERLAPTLAEPLPTFVPLTLYGPLNLALANNPEATGGFSRDFMSSQSLAGNLDLGDPQHLEFLLHGDAMAWRWIREHPADYAHLVLRKGALFFGAGRLGWTLWNFPGGLEGVRRPVDLFVPDSAAAAWIVWPLALAGLALALRQGGAARRWALVVLLLLGAALVTTALFFGYARQGLLFLPFAFSLAAVALARAAAALPWKPRRGRALAAAGALALLALASWGATLDRNYRASGTTLPGRPQLNPDLDVRLEPMAAEP